MRADQQGSGTSTIDSTDSSDEQNAGQQAMQVDKTIVIRSTAAEVSSYREQSRAELDCLSWSSMKRMGCPVRPLSSRDVS